MAWAFVQVKDSGTATATFTSNTTSGNQIFAVVNCVSGLTSVAISPGSGTFTRAVTHVTGGAITSEIWECPNVTGGITPTVTGTGGSGVGITIYEFSGGDTSGTTDGTNNNGATSTALTTLAITTVNNGDLVLKGFACAKTPSGAAETSWTEVNPTATGNVSGYIIQSTAGAITGTDVQSPSGDFAGVIASFTKASSSVVPSFSSNPRIFCP